METKETFQREINKPTFISGGLQGSRIRDINGGHVAVLTDNAGYIAPPFVQREVKTSVANGSFYSARLADFVASTVVPVGPDNAPANLSKRLWRRVS
jgi:hypothetical protein